jgi:hypothetical protein
MQWKLTAVHCSQDNRQRIISSYENKRLVCQVEIRNGNETSERPGNIIGGEIETAMEMYALAQHKAQ